ncbi:MAG: hypothetical protein EXS08_10205 [Planctomycetes bacterium]|nr:hypothetical protein [Planctomycetota bacterium]
MNRPHFGLVLSLSCVASALGACSPAAPRPSGRPNVVLICLDTVRADHLGTYGCPRATTPALDALAARSLSFADASATAGWTKPSVPSFLTGTYPCQHGVYEGSARDEAGAVTDILPASSLTLAEVFEQNGYQTAAFVHNAQLRAGNGFEQGFGTYQQENMDARAIRWRGLDWLDQERGGKPFFLYLHFLDAHWPYPAPEQWLSRFASAEATAKFRGKDSKALYAAINDGTYQMTSDDRAALEALYDGSLAYLDSELGQFFAGLALRGLDQNTIVCVVADHGEEFGEHGKVGHGHGLWENLLRVPWILHVPGRAARRFETPVSLIDLFPTLLAAAGLPQTGALAGLDRLATPDAKRPILAEHKAPDRYFQSLREGDAKLQRKFTPPKVDESAVVAFPLAVGTRWEAEFERKGDALVATQLKPREEEPDDPPELKGRIEGLSASDFRIAGLRVRYDAKSKHQTDVGTLGPELANGQIVKVRGPHADGALYAERIKFYAASESEQLEVRATVEAVQQTNGLGQVTLGGFALALTAETALKDTQKEARKRVLAREEIVQLLETGATAFAAANRYEVERQQFDVRVDRGELTPRAAEAGTPLERQLDELGTALAQKRIFGAGDQKALDAAAMKALQDIGYGGGDH